MFINYKKQILIALIVYVGQSIVGVSLGWTAPSISKLQNPEQTPLPEVITEVQASWIASITYVGTFIGPYVGGYLSNYKGRKITMMFGSAVSAVGFLLKALATNINMIFVGRVLLGFGSGITYVINLVYLGEIASTNIRGIILTLTSVANTFGTFLGYTVGPYVSYAGTGWLGFAIASSFVIGGFFIPESPVFQVLKGEDEKAKENLISLGRGDELDKVIATVDDLKKVSKAQEWIDIFTIKVNRKALILTTVLTILQQLTGVVTIIFFVTSIFEAAGSSVEPHIATIIIGVTQLFASITTPFFVERSGRKVLLLVSSMLTALSLATLGVYFYLEGIQHSSVPNIGWLPLASLIVCFLAFYLGLAVIPATLTGEMFAGNVRSTGSTITITVGWVVGFAVSSAFGYMVPGIGADFTFWIYSFFSIICFLYTLIFIPETSGKSLLEIQEMLSK
ncbi:facilitated trehalose transporter Tret1-like [Anticarsia gemmatalis]|uniref:facilitated trehalose transporter Tret1-like n=1 Tax=Anticarsia gemmatalis TaxID=129554 RepID=UPI003F772599